MTRFYIVVALICMAMTASAQQPVPLKVINDESGEPLAGATVRVINPARSFTTDSSGQLFFPPGVSGKVTIEISYVGFHTEQREIALPLTAVLEWRMKHDEEEGEEEEVIILSTRTSRNIRNVPTRVETIELEEIDEKSNMRPSNVSMLLHESTGIQVQQTSATSANASIRIQGLDGRYTQLLKDGFPSFGNFASGLSVLEIPPLDLKQVEIIKGPASPLFGGGAIAGVVNFISKTPKTKKENNLLFNQSHIGQTNLGYFSSGRNTKQGYTLLALVNNQLAYDVDDDDFTEVPKSFEVTLHPKWFIYPSEGSTIIIGNSFTKGIRKGGDMQVIKKNGGGIHQYLEENKTTRNSTTFEWQRKISDSKSFTARQGLSFFDRSITVPNYLFDGMSLNSFTDLTLLINKTNHSLVGGVTFVYDHFNEKSGSAANRDNANLTAGAYFQDTWDISDRLKLESGLRLDYVRYSNAVYKNQEFFALPRVSMLVSFSPKLSSRIGAGLGYKVPTLFTEATETIQYQNVQQLNNVKAERSYGGTADINYKTSLGELDIAFNHMFFYTWIDKPLVLQGAGFPDYVFVNANEPIQSKGFETNAKLIFKHDFKLFLGYTFSDVHARYQNGNDFLPLVPKHKFNSALIYEKHDFLKMGLEGYYTSPQYLHNGFRTEGYWEFGFMAEKIWEKFSVYLNFENFTDTRQSRFKPVVTGHATPAFDDIWTHTEGFVVNGGVKIRL